MIKMEEERNQYKTKEKKKEYKKIECCLNSMAVIEEIFSVQFTLDYHISFILLFVMQHF